MYDGRIPVGVLDFTTREFARDPATGYDAIRSQTPVSWQQGSRSILVTRYADSVQAYKDPALAAYDLAKGWRKISRNAKVDLDRSLSLYNYMPFVFEGARHTALRAAMAKSIAPFAGANEVFARRIEKFLSRVRNEGGFNLVHQFAGTLVFEILCDLMAFPEDERDAIRPLANISWALDANLSVRRRIAANAVLARCMEPVIAHVRATLARSGSSLIHHIAHNLPDDEPDRISATAHLLTVVLVMGNDALAGCITYPVRRMIGEDAVPDRAPPQSGWAAISDDAIRFASPVGFSTRFAKSDTEIGGYSLKAGDIVSIAPFAADRDPVVFEHPRHIVPRPKLGVGMAFAAGAHVCVGLRLTRSVVHCAYKALAELPPLKAGGSVSHGEGHVVRTLTSCPVEFR